MAHTDPTEPARQERPPKRRRILLAAAAGALVFGSILWFVAIPYPWSLHARHPERTSLMEQRAHEARSAGVPFQVRQQWVPLEEISPELVRAVVVAEDYRFREHEGIDWVSLAEEVRWTGDDSFSWLSPPDVGALVGALRYAWENRDELRGRSTITQQLAKNLYYGTERSLLRKGLEFVVAGRLERRLDKDRILEIYLNFAEWGPGIFGVEAASQAYFGRPAAKLTMEQAAALAATLPHPLTSNPRHRPARMLWRKDLILDRLDPDRRFPPIPVPAVQPDIKVEFDFDRDLEPQDLQVSQKS